MIDPGGATYVLFPVLKDVKEPVAGFAGRSHRSRMVAVGPNGTRTPERSVDGARNSDRQTSGAAPERPFRGGFDDGVQMVRLYGKVNHPKELPRGGSQRASNREEGTGRA
jgi:hypothetical protein